MKVVIQIFKYSYRTTLITLKIPIYNALIGLVRSIVCKSVFMFPPLKNGFSPLMRMAKNQYNAVGQLQNLVDKTTSKFNWNFFIFGSIY